MARSNLTQLRLMVMALSFIVAGALACEPGRGLEIVNETDIPIVVDYSPELPHRGEPDEHEARLEPGESTSLLVLRNESAFFSIDRDRGGRIALLQFSWEELEAMDFQFAVTDALLAVP